MPIVVPAPEGSELTQGDILKGIPFCVMGPDGSANVDPKATHVLVLSRPCKAIRDGGVVVAPVSPAPLDVSALNADPSGGLDRLRRYFASVRDGSMRGEFSDSLYLGEIPPNKTKRFACDLNTLGTILVPKEPAERHQWVNERRVARMHEAFLRDLHTRLVLTFTRLGFDDYAWYSDADLSMMITAGEAEVAHCQLELSNARRAIETREAASAMVAAKMQEEVQRKQTNVDAAQRALRPYVEERERRSGT